MLSEHSIVLRHTLLAEMIARLVIHAIEQGYTVSFNLTMLHCEALVTLYRDDKRITDRADYDALGVWWETRHPLCKHGGAGGGSDYRWFGLDSATHA